MPELSAGILMYRITMMGVEVFLGHPGGPIYGAKDEGAWSIPKGLLEGNEDALEAAKREFKEETSITLGEVPFLDLGSVAYASGKKVFCFAVQKNYRGDVTSNTCTVEYPKNSGEYITVPEIDKAEYFTIEEARIKITPRQLPFLDRLITALRGQNF